MLQNGMHWLQEMVNKEKAEKEWLAKRLEDQTEEFKLLRSEVNFLEGELEAWRVGKTGPIRESPTAHASRENRTETQHKLQHEKQLEAAVSGDLGSRDRSKDGSIGSLSARHVTGELPGSPGMPGFVREFTPMSPKLSERRGGMFRQLSVDTPGMPSPKTKHPEVCILQNIRESNEETITPRVAEPPVVAQSLAGRRPAPVLQLVKPQYGADIPEEPMSPLLKRRQSAVKEEVKEEAVLAVKVQLQVAPPPKPEEATVGAITVTKDKIYDMQGLEPSSPKRAGKAGWNDDYVPAARRQGPLAAAGRSMAGAALNLELAPPVGERSTSVGEGNPKDSESGHTVTTEASAGN